MMMWMLPPQKQTGACVAPQVQDKKPLGAAYQRIAKSLAKEKAQVGQQKSTVTLPRGCQG